MKAWKELGVVDTIYEEEDGCDDYSSTHSPSLSPTYSASPPSPLQDIVKTWSLATGLATNALVHVQDQCFHLHKDPLISKSGYLKRQLTGTSEITLSPPLKITAETFSAVIDYCYSYQTVITPFNVAALRVAAELLEMTVDNGRDDLSLRRKTESYFCQAVSVNREFATVVLRSCLALLPEAEEMGSLASRCIEALGLIDGVDEVESWGEEMLTLKVEEFYFIAHSMHDRFEHDHDLLYRIVDFYIKEHAGKLAEEEKARLCSCVDCNRLSPNLIMHAVQNPRMPLRFVIRAMLVEQLNTRRSIFATITTAAANNQHNINKSKDDNQEPMTLGAILQRDAALRHVAQLKASMEATSSKIERLEKDLIGMKKLLVKTEKSSSFRFSSERKVSKETGWRSFRLSDYRREQGDGGIGNDFSPSSSDKSNTVAAEKTLGWKLLNGLKTAFRKSSKSLVTKKVERDGDGDADREVLGLEDEQPYHHRRARSLV